MKKLCIITALVLVLLTVAYAAELPYLETFAKSADAGTDVGFTPDDFISHVVGDAELEGIVLTALPLPAAGTLCVGERELLVGEAVTSARLGELVFKPSDNADIAATFSFVPVFSSGAGINTTISVSTLRKQNHAPVAENASFEAIKNIAVTCAFPASDADGDPLIFTIVAEPKKGTLSLNDDGTFIYTPKQNKTGTDSFTFTAADPSGAVSEVAKITIKIIKNAAKMTYTDMDGNPAHYAALKLAAEGVLIGQRIGDGYVFSPEQTITRGEFIAIALTCLDIDVVPVMKTGFADDASTPAWVKPYAAAALSRGIVSGVPTGDGRTTLAAEQAITRAEAAVILTNALGLSRATLAEWVSDIADVPAWAEASVAATTEGGILKTFSDGTLKPMSYVTRADAAEMLVGAMKNIVG